MSENIVSLELLTDMAGGDNKFIVEMISLFIKQSDELLLDIEKSILEEDYDTMKKAIHKLKPSAALFTLNHLINIIADFELKKVTEISKEEAISVFEEIKKLLKDACNQLTIEKEKFNC